jgi:DtxR family transcriptional regulator, Mn-dependent transcriptional regulator
LPTSTVENYLKQLYLEQQDTPDHLVTMGRLASAMGVVPGTATSMVKTLADSGLVSYEPRGGVRLTPGGEQLALHVLRRHRLLELFLVKVLGLDWSEVHEEAEELEHAISEKVLARIDEYLGHPISDPHGDPIPSAQGAVLDAPLESLASCPLQQRMRIARVMDQDAPFLQFADRCGLTPGIPVVVESRDPHAASVTIRPDTRPPITLGTAAAAKILVAGT